jgi:hypothetical protein
MKKKRKKKKLQALEEVEKWGSGHVARAGTGRTLGREL